MKRPKVVLFADVLGGFGGIETYLDALARRLHSERILVEVAVCLNDRAPFLKEIEALGVPVYVQPRVPGDRWQLRQRLLVRHVSSTLERGDWVFCVRQPMFEIYLPLVRAVHRRGAKIAASWMFAPEYLPVPVGGVGQAFCQAVRESDAIISVSNCTKHQFQEEYGYEGEVKVVRYHNRERFDRPVPLPAAPPYAIGYMGRIAIEQKNLDSILDAYRILMARRTDVVFNIHGGGQDLLRLRDMVKARGLSDCTVVHGAYDQRRDLGDIIANNHIFIYTSRFEGGPCLSLLELLQAGRFVVSSPVGGIPDIYAGRPEIGDLVNAGSPEAIADSVERAIARIAQGQIDPQRIRDVYSSEFHDCIAHAQWTAALGLTTTRESGSFSCS